MLYSDTDDSGFESVGEEDIIEEIPPGDMYSVEKNVENTNFVDVKEPIRENLPLFNNNQFSLEPDMIFGWRPTINSGLGAIPLFFDKEELPNCSSSVTGRPLKTIYNGFRPKDTYEMHAVLSGADTYPSPNILKQPKLHIKLEEETKSKKYEGMSPTVPFNELRFDSKFESGNLDKVVKVRDGEYDLYIRSDANSRRHTQWFHFSVENILRPHRVKFNILNFTKDNLLYTQGMQPVIYSTKQPGKGWHTAGVNITFKISKLMRYITRRKPYYSMTFDYDFELAGDKVYFAYSLPYTYSKLLKFLNEITKIYEGKTLLRETLCKTLSGVDVPILTISDLNTTTHNKEVIIITCRVHSGETNASWMMEGFIRFLLDFNNTAIILREKLVFKIVPMMNPDGVIIGNYRNNLAGNDLNRQYIKPDKKLHPSVYHVKELLKSIESGKILAVIDFHAHSKKKNAFLYAPYFPLHSIKYYKIRMIPKLLSEKTDLFRYYSCKFRSEKLKESTARIAISREFKIDFCYTLEASFYGYITKDRVTINFNELNLQEIGRWLAKSIREYIEIRDEENRERERRKRRRIRKRRKQGHTSYSEDFNNPSSSQSFILQPNGCVLSDESFSSSSDTEPRTPLKMSKPRKRRMPALIQRIKEAAAQEHDSDSGGSDSSLSEDDLYIEDQNVLHAHIISIIDQFEYFNEDAKKKRKTISTTRPPTRNKVKKQSLERDPSISVHARSSLAKYFSRATKKDKPQLRKVSPVRIRPIKGLAMKYIRNNDHSPLLKRVSASEDPPFPCVHLKSIYSLNEKQRLVPKPPSLSSVSRRRSNLSYNFDKLF